MKEKKATALGPTCRAVDCYVDQVKASVSLPEAIRVVHTHPRPLLRVDPSAFATSELQLQAQYSVK